MRQAIGPSLENQTPATSFCFRISTSSRARWELQLAVQHGHESRSLPSQELSTIVNQPGLGLIYLYNNLQLTGGPHSGRGCTNLTAGNSACPKQLVSKKTKGGRKGYTACKWRMGNLGRKPLNSLSKVTLEINPGVS